MDASSRGSSSHVRRAFVVLALWVTSASPVWAISALEQTKTTLEAARSIVAGDGTHNEKLTKLSALLQNFLDTDSMGRQALDKRWEQFSASQQKEFLTLFRELFQRTYVQKLLLFDKPDFGYVGEESVDGATRVETKIITPRDEFAVIYEMRQQGNLWMAKDIRIEDLSLTTNFRRQLERLLAKSSPEDLLNRMRKKYGPAGSGGDDDL